jgi:hypothetical protein
MLIIFMFTLLVLLLYMYKLKALLSSFSQSYFTPVRESLIISRIVGPAK